jgi:hypothetical protein
VILRDSQQRAICWTKQVVLVHQLKPRVEIILVEEVYC